MKISFHTRQIPTICNECGQSAMYLLRIDWNEWPVCGEICAAYRIDRMKGWNDSNG